jgi:integrase
MVRHLKPYEFSEANNQIIKEFIKFKKAQKGNTISPRSLGNIEQHLRKLSDFAGTRNLKELTDKEIQDFFNSIDSEKYTSRDTYATTYIQFYRWVFKLPRKNMPLNMAFFYFTSAKTKRKNRDPEARKKFFITSEEYKKMIEYCTDQYGRNKAIIETYFLIGMRPEELPQLQIKHIETRKDGITLCHIPFSKTFPRVVGFPETPFNLLQFIENHPNKNDKEAYLFFPFRNPNKKEPLEIDNIRHEMFQKMRNDLKDQGVKQTLTLKSFRKTRATIVFENQHRTGLTLKQIGNIFGWTENEVAKRQAEYLLTDNEDTIKKYCTENYVEPTQQQLKKELKKQKDTSVDINELNNEINSLKDQINDLTGIVLTSIVIAQPHMKEDLEQGKMIPAWKNYQESLRKLFKDVNIR